MKIKLNEQSTVYVNDVQYCANKFEKEIYSRQIPVNSGNCIN